MWCDSETAVRDGPSPFFSAPLQDGARSALNSGGPGRATPVRLNQCFWMACCMGGEPGSKREGRGGGTAGREEQGAGGRGRGRLKVTSGVRLLLAH